MTKQYTIWFNITPIFLKGYVDRFKARKPNTKITNIKIVIEYEEVDKNEKK